MNTDDKIVVIRCETCTYRLKYPAFFLEAKKTCVAEDLQTDVSVRLAKPRNN